jgi:hypothetical protein
VRLFKRKPKVPKDLMALAPADLLESWADMIEQQLKLTPEDVDANGFSDQAVSRHKIQSLRAGAKALRGSAS